MLGYSSKLTTTNIGTIRWYLLIDVNLLSDDGMFPVNVLLNKYTCSRLTSLADANAKCEQVGTLIHGIQGFRMAEFHDGGTNAGWGFWTLAHSIIEGLDAKPVTVQGSSLARYWVSINGQDANPW
jgi:hypothetical protein